MLNTPTLLSEYDFTDDCISASLTNQMLYVVTKNGLETYTTRLYSAAASSAASSFKEPCYSSPRYHPETPPRLHLETVDRERTWSSLSFSSGSEVDCKSQAEDSVKEFSEEENSEMQRSDEVSLTEGEFV